MHVKLLGIFGAVCGLASLFAVEIGAELLEAPSWFKDSAVGAATIGSTILFLKYLRAEREAQRAADIARDNSHAETISDLVRDFRADRELDRQERREGQEALRKAAEAMRCEGARVQHNTNKEQA